MDDRTLLSVGSIVSLLELCLNATYLQFKGNFYQQTQGTAMGSPMSVTIANLVMEDVKQHALNSFVGAKPLFWKRYVDDTCTAIHENKVEVLHEHLNSIEPSIQFTREMKEDGGLPFLDVQLKRSEDGSVSTSVYHKKMYTDQYLHFSSHHSLAHKRFVINTLFIRASRLSSSSAEQSRSAEEKHVARALSRNGYPPHLLHNHKISRRKDDVTCTEKSTRVTLPYIQGISEAIQRVLGIVDIRTSFKSPNSLRDILSHPKDPIPLHYKNNVIHQIPCQDRKKSYLGQTGRSLSHRFK